MTGPPGPPMAIGTVGRIRRSQDQIESSPIRSASSATSAILAGEATRPAIGRCTPNLIDVISSSLHRLWLGRPAPPVVLIGCGGAGLRESTRSTDRPSAAEPIAEHLGGPAS